MDDRRDTLEKQAKGWPVRKPSPGLPLRVESRFSVNRPGLVVFFFFFEPPGAPAGQSLGFYFPSSSSSQLSLVARPLARSAARRTRAENRLQGGQTPRPLSRPDKWQWVKNRVIPKWEP